MEYLKSQAQGEVTDIELCSEHGGPQYNTHTALSVYSIITINYYSSACRMKRYEQAIFSIARANTQSSNDDKSMNPEPSIELFILAHHLCYWIGRCIFLLLSVCI